MNKKIYVILMLLILLSIKCPLNRFSVKTGEETSATLMNCVDETRYAEDLAYIAIDRTLRSPGHDMVRDFCALRLSELGFNVELDSYGTGVNVIGRIEGTADPSETVVLSAHYDSICTGCPGADDNASGVAGVLEAARVLSKARYNKTLVIALWDEEEKGLKSPRGLIGSRSYSARARHEKKDIILAVVFEMIGYRSFEPGSQKFPQRMKAFFPDEMNRIAENQNRGDFICLTVNEDAHIYSDIYTAFAEDIALPVTTLKISRRLFNIHDFRRSDHAAFWEKGYSAMMIGDTINYRNENYHCKKGKVDSISRLDTAFARDTIRATVATLAKILIIKQQAY